MTPTIEDGILTWRVPLGDGAVIHVALEDCAHYVRWLFDNPALANGMNLEVAIEHVKYADLATAFERVTGHRAQYLDTPTPTSTALINRWRICPLATTLIRAIKAR